MKVKIKKRKRKDLQIALDECGHALWHMLNCEETKFCPDCERMAKEVIKLTGWNFHEEEPDEQ